MGEIAAGLGTLISIEIVVDLLFQDFTYQVISEFCSGMDAGGQFAANLVADIGVSLTEGSQVF